MTSWEIICEKLEKDETSPLIRALKLLVGDAKDLALISMEEIEEIANQGLLKETTKPLLYDYLNSWQVIFYRIALSDDAMKTCIKEFRVPSDVLSMCEWMKEVELEHFSTITHRALLSRLDDLLNPGKWQMLNTVQDSKDDEARNEAKQLFSTITFPDDKDCCISSDIVVDDKHENNTSGYIPFCQLLSLASETVKVIDSSIGTIENLDKDIKILHGFNHLQLVDLCDNRLDQSQWVNIMSILSFVSKNQGALLIYDNPVCKCRELFQQLCIQNRQEFLRLIWIPKKDLDRRYISETLGIFDEYAQKTIFHAHIAFYELMSKFHRKPNFSSKKFSELRYFKKNEKFF